MKTHPVLLKAAMLTALIITGSLFSTISAAHPENPTMDSIDNQQLYLVIKSNNVEYIGHIIKDDGREVLINTEKLGKIYIPKADIRSIEKISDTKAIIRGDYYSAGPFVTRYAFTTNALPLRKGSNYAKLNLYGPEVHFALTNNFSLGIMSTWAISPFIVVGKYGFNTKNPKLNYSVGTLLGNSGYINNMKTWGGLHFGNITYGTPKDNITLGAGFGYVVPGVTNKEAPEGDYLTSSAYYAAQTERPVYPAMGPVFSFGAITKVGAKASFIFDSMFTLGSVKITKVSNVFVGYDSQYFVRDGRENFTAFILMPGMRFQTKENSAFQVTLTTVSIHSKSIEDANIGAESITFPMPSCSWFFKF